MNDWRDTRLGEPREVRLPSGTVRYHDRGSGPIIVFAHGYLVNANLWRKVVPALAQDFRCIAPDLPLGSHTVPMRRDADLSPPGIARVLADLLEALDLRDVTLVGNDSGGAYSQLVAVHHPERLGRLVLSSCETPEDTWPPTPGGFGLLKATAANPLTYRALYQVLRVPRTWRWHNTYGWLAKYPIEAEAMNSYVRPVIDRADIRVDGRKAIGAVSERYVQDAAHRLVREAPVPIHFVWAAEDRVFPLDHARRYAADLDAKLHTVADSYTYVSEDQPEATARLIASCATA
ncbi:alpha/beta fold hydrolase [Prauserella muralis]|uniref:Hydrolase n=1 Tax=Prauserella muralis TaxID=588067 RepID=A0A2V4AZV5_9PSEU|nr:alpha/beta hydrolase [Prauserella muralis]PXY27474.1 hydrolase [Prauserella muralis]TWE22814.1 pimeloyl-ACP methyl ester carboxylesterase [Prauserella muralis]